MTMEMVDVLTPPKFEKSGVVKERHQAYQDGEWLGTFNLWVVQSTPVPAIVYQLRSVKSSWEPDKLDVSAGGHYTAGESLWDGLREAEEELGKKYQPDQVTHIGKRFNISRDMHGLIRHNVLDITMVIDNAPLNSYTLQKDELGGICACPLAELIKVNQVPGYSFIVQVTTPDGETIDKKVDKDSFPWNLDQYHYKVALLAERFVKGEKNLIY